MIERFTLLSAQKPNIHFLNRLFLLFLLFCLIPGLAFAQPANNNCGNAVTVSNLSGGCTNYNFTNATTDLLNGDCAINGVNSLNTWFQFTAIGSDLIVNSDAQGVGSMEITIIEFSPTACNFGSATQIACSASPLNASGLTPGSTYYIVITDPSNGSAGNYSLCVTSQAPNPPPPNDNPCNAQVVIPNGSCTGGTTVDANPDWTIGDPACNGLEESSVWYSATLGPDMDQLQVEVQNLGSVMVIVGTFAPDCNGTFNVEGYNCGSGGPFNVTGLTENTQYWVLVSTPTAQEGTFNVCLTETGLPPGCSDNDFCSQATTYPTPTTGVPCTPLMGCNIGANPEPALIGSCNFPTEEVVWFSFTSDANAGLLSASVVAADPATMSQPSIQVFTGGCGGLSSITDCATGSNGQVTLVNESISPNTNYLVAVSNGFGNGGYFDLCIQTFTNFSACATESDLYVQPGSPSFGSPDNGPYQPGETVTMCFDLINYHADPIGVGNNCQWLQGIVPIFGDCWDPSGFDPTASEPPSLYGGNWGWHTNITYNNTNPNITISDCDGDGDTDICHITEPGCCNTGTPAGTVLPPGWFADMGGSPNNTFGDGNCCNCDMGPWSFCFDLVTKAYPACDANPNFTNCSVKIYTFADGETGSWNGGPSVCAQDVPDINNASLNCCEGPTVNAQTAEVCDGGALFFTITSNQDPNVDYSWTVSPSDNPPNPNQFGAFSGNGPNIAQTLTNDTGSPVTVIYSVSGVNTTEGCAGLPTDFEVTIYPTLEVDIPSVLPICAGECADIEAFATGGSGTYVNFDWNQGLLDGPSSATVCPTVTTSYSVTVTDDLGCTGTASVIVNANSNLIINLQADPGAESCVDLDNPATVTATVTAGGSGVYDYEWYGDATGGGGGADIEVVYDTDTYHVIITDLVTGCTGTQQIDITINPLPFIVIIDPQDAICESDLLYCFDVFVDNSGTGNWGGVADVNGCVFPNVLGAGIHTVTYEFTDDNTCYDIATYDFIIDPVPAMPAALPPVTLCSGAPPQTYTVPAVPGAFNYTWTVPTGATITAGQNTNSVTINWTGSQNGQVCVTANNDCGASPASCFNATISNPPVAPVAPADVSFCSNVPLQSFSITAVPDATSYIWTVPSGVTITGGQTTTDITVNWGTAPSGQVCVAASNACGTSATSCANITILTAPAAPTPPANVTICAGATGQVYTIAAVPTATEYTWTVPAGGTITAGQTTTSITVDWAANATTGQICVTADNGCGASAPGCFDVTVGTIPATPTPPANATVCTGDTNVPYAVTAVAFADTYTWTLPAGATIASGANTNAITVDWGTATSGQVCVTANNSCGSSAPACFDVTVNDIPVAPQTLADVTVCANTNGDMYSVAIVPGATSYTWTAPAGSTIAAGQTTNSVSINWGTTSGQVCVTANNDCGSSPQACFNATIIDIPVSPTPPANTIICAGLAGDTYSVALVPGALTYTWTVPAGATITNGQTTNTIDINWGTATSGQVCITSNNTCGSSAPACFDVTVGDVPPMPIPPANSNVCAGTANSNYAIAPVANATGYAWTVPAGATITNGQNTTSINVNWGTATTGDICVTASNNCGDSPQACFTVTVDNVPTAPTAPVDAIICAGAQGEVYSIAAVPGATSYTWIVPTGASIVGGLGTTSITVNWGANAASGQICVTADNNCGMSPQACFNVTINNVPAAAMVPGPSAICQNLQGDVYTIAAVANATGYQWTVPASASIASGQNTTSIEINWGATGGQVCVTPFNDCGNGPQTCFAVTVNATPQAPIAPQNATVCQGTQNAAYAVNAVAGALTYTWTVPANATISTGQNTNQITIDWGTATSGQVCVTANNNCGASAPACFNVTIDETPASPVAPADNAVCAGTQGSNFSILPVAGADTYTWTTTGGATISGGQNTTNITVNYNNTATATICVTANNDCGSSAPACFTTTINPIPTATFMVETPICVTGTSTITYTGSASANATYTWNFNGGINTTGATGAGPYVIDWNTADVYTVSLTVSENGCISTPVTMDVIVEAPLAVPVINCNTTTSSIEFTWNAIPGATGYLVNGSPNAGTTYLVTGLNAGDPITITVTALGSGPCGNSEATQTCVAEDCPAVSIAIDAVAPICLDANTSAINLNAIVTGSAGTGTGVWSGNGITNPALGTFDPNTATIGNNAITYTYTEGPCMYSQSIGIVVNNQPTADFTVPSPICATDTITINYTGTATASATYNWDFGTADYINGSGAGPYQIHWPAGSNQTVTLNVTSVNGCPSEQVSQTVVIDAPLAVPVIVCNSTTTSIEFTWAAIPGATEYLVNNVSQPGTSYTATGLNAGDMVTITVIAVSNNSCSNSQASQTCTADDCPPVQIDIDPVGDICLDANAMPFNLNAVVSGPGTGQWQGPGITNAATGLFDPNAPTVTPGNNTITYFYQDGACTANASITIVINPQPVATFTVDPTVCAGDNVTVTYTGTYNAAATYIWDFGNGTVTNDLGSEVYEVQMPLAGLETITLQVIENNCASTIASQNVQVDAPLANPNITCVTTTTSITFSWDAIPGANGYTVNGAPQGGTSFTISGLNTGDSETITVVAIGTGACGNSSATATCIAEDCPPGITVAIDPVTALCVDGAPVNLNTVVTGGNGGSILWTGPGITDQVNGTFDPGAANLGVNQITVTYSEPPCNYTATIDIVVNTLPSANFTMDATACIGDDVSVSYQGTFSGTATYNWDFGNGTIVADLGQENYTISFPSGGNQTVTLEVINNGCNSGQQSQSIQVDAPLADPVIICEPTLNSVNFTWAPVAGATGYIVNGTPQAGTSFEFTGLNQGDIVNITVVAIGNGPCGNSTSTESCEASDCPPVSLVIDPVGDICEMATPTGMIDLNVTITGSNGTGTGTWSGTGIVNATTGMFDPNTATLVNGANTVFFSFDEDGCAFQESIVINVYDLPAANAGPTAELSCNNGNQTTLSGSGDGTPMWSGGTYASGQNTFNPVVTSPGLYTLTVTTATGCTNTATVNITADPTVPVAVSNGDLILDCNNNTTVTLQAAGTLGADYQVTWTGPSINAGNINEESILLSQASDAGAYSFIITNTALGCDSEPAFINVGLDTLPPNAIIQFVGSLDCSASGVTLSTNLDPNTSATWEDPEGTTTSGSQIQALVSGTYTLYVVNNINGCDNFSTFLVEDNVAYPIADAGEDQVLDCTTSLVTLDGNGSQMGATIVYEWTNANGDVLSTNLTVDVMEAGMYILTTFDTDNTCTEMDTVFVTADLNAPVAEAGDMAEFGCADETVSLSASASTGADIYQWTDASGAVISNNVTAEVTEPGTYFLYIENSGNACNDTDVVIVNSASNFPSAAEIEKFNPSCFGETDGYFIVNEVLGGTPPYTYSIDGETFSSTNIFTFLGEGTYNLTVEDADGCTFETEVTIVEPAELSIDFGTPPGFDFYAIDLGTTPIELNPIYSISDGAIDTVIWSPMELLTCNGTTGEDSLRCLYPSVIEDLFNTTTFTAFMVDTFGCSVERDITVQIIKDRPVYIPNAFSPNADGNNEFFTILSGRDSGIQQINFFRVFNRWGEVVHEAEFFQPDDNEFGWDGTFKGDYVNPGVFVYVAEIEFIDGFKILYKGDVTVMK